MLDLYHIIQIVTTELYLLLKDEICPPDNLMKAVKTFKNVLVMNVDDTGHMPMVERPDDVNDAINEFIGQLSD